MARAFGCLLYLTPLAYSLRRSAEPRPEASDVPGDWDQWLRWTIEEPPWRPAAIGQRVATDSGQRVAVLTSGTLIRYSLMHTVRGLLEPMVNQGFVVDYYLALNEATFEPNKKGNNFQQDPIFNSTRPDGKRPDIQKLITKTVLDAGCKVAHIDVFDGIDISARQEQTFIEEAKWPNHGWTDDHSKAVKSSVTKWSKAMERLWLPFQKTEAQHGEYDHVITLKDDSIWLSPFDLKQLLQSNASGSDRGAHLFMQTCSAHISTYPTEGSHSQITESIFVLSRAGAEPFIRQHSMLLNGGLSEDDAEANEKRRSRYWGIGAFEGFQKFMALDFGIEMIPTPARLLPMQRAGRVLKDGNLTTCLSYVCDSRTAQVDYLYPVSLGTYPPCTKQFKPSYPEQN